MGGGVRGRIRQAGNITRGRDFILCYHENFFLPSGKHWGVGSKMTSGIGSSHLFANDHRQASAERGGGM